MIIIIISFWEGGALSSSPYQLPLLSIIQTVEMLLQTGQIIGKMRIAILILVNVEAIKIIGSGRFKGVQTIWRVYPQSCGKSGKEIDLEKRKFGILRHWMERIIYRFSSEL